MSLLKTLREAFDPAKQLEAEPEQVINKKYISGGLIPSGDQASKRLLTADIKARSKADQHQRLLDELKAARAELARLHSLAVLESQQPVAIKLTPDPYDEREGLSFSLADLKKLRDLPAGTPLYAMPPATARQVPDAVAHRLINADGEVMTDWHDGPPPDDFIDLCGAAMAGTRVELAYAAPPRQPPTAHPMQPIVVAPNGVIRFKQNKIVRHLLDFAQPLGCGLNELARMDFDADDRMQLAQLIGYSVSGYGDLSYASRDSIERADSIAASMQPEPLNQCDGCRAGVPLTNGMHHMGKPDGYPDPMACTSHLYKPTETPEAP